MILVAPGFQLENIGWGKYEISSYTLTNFSWRIVSSSGNYQTAPRRFSWYTVGK